MTCPVVADGANLPDEGIVELIPGVAIDEIHASYGTNTLAEIPGRGLYLVGLPDGADPEELEAALQDDPRVEEAELDDDCQSPEAVDGHTQPFFFYVPPSSFLEQWAPDTINLADAHAVSMGQGVVVAVLDTGADPSHPLLMGRIEPGGYDFVDGDAEPLDEGNELDDDGDGTVDELVGHGTFVAGVIASVAPAADMLVVRVLDSEGNSDVFRVVQGIYFAIDAGVHVINLSLSTRSHNHILRDAVAAAHEAGILVIASVGNEDRHMPVPMPAGEDTVMAIASSDDIDLKSTFSNYGSYVTVTAPGDGLVSGMPGGFWAQASGTSMSTALVTGTAALIRAHEPALTPDMVLARLTETAQELDSCNPDYQDQLGAGRLDAGAAVAGQWGLGTLPPAGWMALGALKGALGPGTTHDVVKILGLQ